MRNAICCIVAILLCTALVGAQALRPASQPMVPSGMGYGVPGVPPPTVDSVHQGNGIDYHGGPILSGTVNVYLIFYGNWKNGAHQSDSKASKQLIKQFVKGVSGTPFQMINSTYGDTNSDVTGLVKLAGVTGFQYPYGSSLTNTKITHVVEKAITKRSLPVDTNGVYFVLTSSDVDMAGFCSQFCGYHFRASILGQDLKYSFIGNPDRCAGTCEVQLDSPNHNSGADGLVNVLSHELEEAITDPDINAWYMSNGNENADACAWKWGTLLGGQIGQGGYNQTFGGHNWLLQMNWENARGGGCDNFLGGPFHHE